MKDIDNHDMANQAKKILTKRSGLTYEEVGLLIAEIKRVRYVNAQLAGGKGNMERERNEYKGRYYRMLEGLENLREYVAHRHDNTIRDTIDAIKNQPEGPVTREEKNVLFGVEHRARRLEAANREVAKVARGMLNRGEMDELRKFLERESQRVRIE